MALPVLTLLLPFSPLSRLKKVLKCHTPDPSKFFSQLTSEHGGDVQVGGWDGEAEVARGVSGMRGW